MLGLNQDLFVSIRYNEKKDLELKSYLKALKN
jgi:hypothetical protein